MIDPFAALEAVNKAVSLVKKAASTIDNVESLGPVLGRFFDAKASAAQVVQQAKAGGFKGSAMGQALELELALEQAREFESQVQMLFFQSNKMDVWNRIKARADAMEKDSRAQERRKVQEARDKKKREDEMIEIVLAVFACLTLCALVLWGAYEAITACNGGGCA